MADNSEIGFGNHAWFRWLPRGFLLAAALVPILFVILYYVVVKVLGPKYWDWGSILLFSPLIIVTAIAWYKPIIGGLIAIAIAPPGYIFILIIRTWGKQFINPITAIPEVFTSAVLLVLGGILSIIWGLLLRRRRRGQA